MKGAQKSFVDFLKERMVGAAGFEPATSRTPSVRATRLRHAPTNTYDRREFSTATIAIQLNFNCEIHQTLAFLDYLYGISVDAILQFSSAFGSETTVFVDPRDVNLAKAG